MRASAGQLIAANATGCLEVFTTPYPESSWQLPWLHSLFGNAPAVATGVAAALKAKGRTDVRVLGQGGDGGTVDIGFACLSGMFERNDDVLYVCYDNEGYMNTGVQRSGATPPAARTATTQAVGDEPGQRLRPGQERAADRARARDPLRRDGDDRRPARPRGQGRARDGDARRALPARARDLPAGLGHARRATRSGSRGSRRRPGCSRSSRARTATSPRSPRSASHVAGRGVPAPAAPLRATCSSPSARDDVIARIQARADRNIQRFGLLP